MKFFRNLKIAPKLILGFALVTVVTAIIGILGITSLQTVSEDAARSFEKYGNAQGYLGNMTMVVERQRGALARINLMRSPEYTDQQKEMISTADAIGVENLLLYEAVCETPEEIAQVEELKQLIGQFQEVVSECTVLADDGYYTESFAYLTLPEHQDIINKTNEKAQQLMTQCMENADANQQALAKEVSQTRMIMFIAMGAGLLFIVLIVWLVSRSISKPIGRLAHMADRLAEGDTNVDYSPLYGKNEVGSLAASLDTVVQALDALVQDTNTLVQAATQGDLSARADSSRHKGDYAQIVNGVNQLLETILAPIQVASDVLGSMATGNLQVYVDGNYQGDHAIIQNALNDTIDNLKVYIDETKRILTNMSDGNFRDEISIDFLGDFTDLKDSINAIILSLSEVLANIKEAAGQVTEGSIQVSDGAQNVSQGATEQASAVQQLTATMTQLAEQVRQTAQNASEANDHAQRTKGIGIEGTQSMQNMQDAMEEINEASANISKIIKVIDDIAFQTNILALNAAVEAARAGVHGKGFAVVAEEVRNLAEKSADAAKETTALIEGSIQKAQMGTQIANDTAQSLESMVESVDRMEQVIGQIATASNEQATGITQANKGIEQMNQVIQNNSAVAEESAASAQELSSQAQIMMQLVDRFQLRTGDGQAMPTASAPSTPVAPPAPAAKATSPSITLSDTEFDKY
ncbi:methyl-accepting chemotaxis protein [Eubacteriales bacterium OttesenSCG-928-M02]|nr:methyl-accepting chemotaxis protein [Eubacteriales bacterium OttesenSCG-928-M02]